MKLEESDSLALQRLREIAIEVFRKFGAESMEPPLNREKQKILAMKLRIYLDEKYPDLLIRYSSIEKIANLNDENFKNIFDGTSRHLSWLLLHEGLSTYFPKFAVHVLGRKPYLIHQTAKSGSTSVNALVERGNVLPFFWNASFERMVLLYGLLGFSNQLYQLTYSPKRSNPLVAAGHFNLPRVVIDFELDPAVAGISMFRNPFELVSSGLRYVWESLSNNSESAVREYPDIDITHVTSAYKQIIKSTSRASDTINVITKILNSKTFIREYNEILEIYYAPSAHYKKTDIVEFFHKYNRLYLLQDVAQASEAIRRDLNIRGEAPQKNVSTLSHSKLQAAVGGPEQLKRLLAPLFTRSAEIYTVLDQIEKEQARTEVRSSSRSPHKSLSRLRRFLGGAGST